MEQARLIRLAFLAAAALAFVELRPPPSSKHDPAPDLYQETEEEAHWRQFNERCASTSLKTLSQAEADFRANNPDWNHVNDFWTSNAAEIYTLTPAAIPRDEAIRLIELSVASADIGWWEDWGYLLD